MQTACKIIKEDNNNKNVILERLIKLENDTEKLDEIKEINNKIIKENRTLKKRIEELEKHTKTVINNNNQKNIINGNVNINNISLVAYGREDMTKIDKKEILKIFRKGYHSTLQLTETVHFNPRYPEYHNIYINNIKDKYAMMYDGNEWALTTKTTLIDRLYEDKKNFIEENLEDFIISLSQSQINALNRWVNTDENDKKILDLKERIKLLLYNSRNIPLETQKVILLS
tara:strand:- start:218 stop:904 length:687 start_codon:yes stop_codon:yes gene_type:complete